MLRSRTITLIAASAVLVTACGDDDGGNGGEQVSAGDYASKICAAFLGWRDAIQERQQDLQEGLSPGISPKEGKEALGGFLSDAVDASDELVTNVDEAGTPDTENGEEAATALQNAAKEARDELEEARAGVADLPTNDRKAFSAAADQLGDGVKNALSQVGGGLEDLESPDLDKAFDEESACQG